MAFAGDAVIAIWNDITPEGRANFYEWHSREHMPERVGIPGFRRGRRYIGLDAQIEFFTLYEADNADVLVGKDYKERLNNPTQWSRDSVGAFRNNLRGICRLPFSQGHAEGAYLFTLRFDIEPGHETAVTDLLSQRVLPEILASPEIVGAHLCICDREMSGTNTSLQRTRQIGVPYWIGMIEGSTAKGTKTAGNALTDAIGSAQGIRGETIGELYQLEYSLAKIGR